MEEFSANFIPLGLPKGKLSFDNSANVKVIGATPAECKNTAKEARTTQRKVKKLAKADAKRQAELQEKSVAIASKNLRRRQKEEQRFNKAMRLLKRQVENRGERWDPEKGRKIVLKQHEREASEKDSEVSSSDEDSDEGVEKSAKLVSIGEESKNAKKRPAEDVPVDEPEFKKPRKLRHSKSKKVEEALKKILKDGKTLKERKREKKQTAKAAELAAGSETASTKESSKPTLETAPKSEVKGVKASPEANEVVKREKKRHKKGAVEQAAKANNATTRSEVPKNQSSEPTVESAPILEVENEKVSKEKKSDEEKAKKREEKERKRQAKAAAEQTGSSDTSSKKHKHQDDEADAIAEKENKEKSHKKKMKKKTKITEEAPANGSIFAGQWNPDALTGDAARKDKFLRLLGASKANAGGRDAAKHKSSAKVEDISKVQSELERQYEAGMKMKHDGGGKRRGLGA